ncbi:MAG: 5'/3'-nucleotidase SurE, partial [Halobacteriales archaeon]
SGCNQGANLGAYVLGRSGTVSAAIEAAFFGVPAIAVSQYVAAREDVTWDDPGLDEEAYAEAADATRYLVEQALEAHVFARCDLLNVNVPDVETEVRGIRVTEPSRVYDMDATHENGIVRLNDRIWQRMAAGDVPDPEGTDRRAVVEGHVSVSPLAAPHTTNHHEVLEGITADYEP